MLNGTSPAVKQTTASQLASTLAQPTFLEHVYELRRRLFWVVATVIVAAVASFWVIEDIYLLLTHPLGSERLYYLTPIGGLSFMFKLCAYVGLTVAVPVLMYHLYKYLEPLMGQWRRSAVFYVGLSSLLAAAGIAFAYFVSLPAALHFLTGFSIGEIEAMLTVDSYLSFVMVYLFGAALLFQIPLLLLIINTMTPLKPLKLLSFMRYVVVGAFVLAAIISPTPDIMNQTILAVPIMFMYLLGVGMVAFQNRARAGRKQRPSLAQTLAADASGIPDEVLQEVVRAQRHARHIAPVAALKPPQAEKPLAPTQPARSHEVQAAARPVVRQAPPVAVPSRSLDGFTISRRTA